MFSVVERDMSFKFDISAVKVPAEMLAMSRISVEQGNTALHVAAVWLDCTPYGDSREKISRLEASTPYGCEGKAKRDHAFLQGRWLQGSQVLPPFSLSPISSTEGNVRGSDLE